ncbi:MAG TPA: hypothetical protein VG713_13055, partial [Pirellulales bacterium]|nr:hypothetical protein [Pirellulales bacterium]
MSHAPAGRRLSRQILAMALGAGLAIVATAAVLMVWMRNPVPMLTVDALDAAERRWRAAQLRDYDLDVEIRGRQPGIV